MLQTILSSNQLNPNKQTSNTLNTRLKQCCLAPISNGRRIVVTRQKLFHCLKILIHRGGWIGHFIGRGTANLPASVWVQFWLKCWTMERSSGNILDWYLGSSWTSQNLYGCSTGGFSSRWKNGQQHTEQKLLNSIMNEEDYSICNQAPKTLLCVLISVYICNSLLCCWWRQA